MRLLWTTAALLCAVLIAMSSPALADGQVEQAAGSAVKETVAAVPAIVEEIMAPVHEPKVSEMEAEKMEMGDASAALAPNFVQDETVPVEDELVADPALVEAMKEPGMQRLARELRSFHNRRWMRESAAAERAADAGIYANDVNVDDSEAMAEERAVRRRQRVRRRNTKNKVKRTHRNKVTANRNKSSRRKASNVNSLRHKNTNSVRTQRPKKQRGSSSSKRRVGSNSRKSLKRRHSSSPSKRRRASDNRKQSSKRKSSKNTRKTRTGDKKQKQRRQNADKNTARKDQSEKGEEQAPEHVAEETPAVAA